MLIRYRFNNFCSFNADSEFCMEAAAGKVKNRFEENFIPTGAGYDLLKTAVIVGENAGGKSNFIGSLVFLKDLFDSNAPVKSIRSYINSYSFLETEEPVQEFEVCLLHDSGYVYEYCVAVDEKGIVRESLSRHIRRKGARSQIFVIERLKNDYRFLEGKAEKQAKIILKNDQNNYGLFISKLALVGSVDAANVVGWMLNNLYPEMFKADFDSAVKTREADVAIIKDVKYLDIFRMVDYSICGLQIDDEKPYSKTIIIRRDAFGNELKRELQQDSAGVREFFAWAVQIFRVVYENKVVLADEMDRVLNPVLSDRVIAYVNGMNHRGQFIFSTHNVLHLNLKTYMKEQIYFVTKDKNSLTSELYSLADFPEVRYETSKIYEFYMKGVLGGTAFD